MEFAVSSLFASKRLAQVPELNQKVQEARKKFDRTKPHDQDSQIAAAEARVSSLQATVPCNIKLSAYSDKGGLLSSASKYASKRLTVDDVKALLNGASQRSQHKGALEAAALPGHYPGSSPQVKFAACKHHAATEGCSADESADSKPFSNFKAHGTTQTPAADAVSAAGCSTGRVNGSTAAIGSSFVVVVVADGTCGNTVQLASAQLAVCKSSCMKTTDARSSDRTGSDRSSSSPSRRQKQLLQQADHLFQKMNEYVIEEVAVSQIEQQLCAASIPSTQSYISVGPLDQASMLTTNSLASIPEESSAGVDGPLIETEGWTPELMSSLALRFQEYGQPLGATQMPDLVTMIHEVQQQQAQELRQQQEQQQQWVESQQAQQQATKVLANRHIQLYQLGVQQQVDRSNVNRNRGGRLMGPYPQHVSGGSKSETTKRLQQAHKIQQGILEGHAKTPDDGAGQQQMASQQGADQTSLPIKQECTTAPAVVSKQCQQQGEAVDNNICTGQGPSSKQTGLPFVTSVEAVTDPEQPDREAIAEETPAESTAGQESSTQSITQTASVLGPSASSGKLQQMGGVQECCLSSQSSSYAVRPPAVRYKCDIPGVPVGSSHGHTSPSGLTFRHLPGSKRQVYAQVQDALAFGNALIAAARELGTLKYAPAGACSGHSN